MRNLCLSTLALVASGLLACGGGSETTPDPVPTPTPLPPMATGPFDLLFYGTAVPHARQSLFVAVIKLSDESVVARDMHSIGTDGSFSFTWSGILEEGQAYRLDFFADHNGNRMCDPPADDHSWRVSLGTVTGPVTYYFEHNGNFTDVCASFP